jgi:hypothetical protein
MLNESIAAYRKIELCRPALLPHTRLYHLLDIGENRRLNPAVLAAFFAFDNVVSDFNVAGGFV